jgi:hypothetical protein
MVRRFKSSAERAPKSDSAFKPMEKLESRQLMSASALPNYSSFLHTNGLAFNGYYGNPIINRKGIQLTDNNPTEQRSAWYTTKLSVDAFSTTFDFNSTKGPDTADGFTFAIQNIGTTALGYDGHDLGYAGVKKSVGIAFNLYNYSAFGSQFGFVASGKVPSTPTSMGNVDLHNGDIFQATVTYDGATLSVSVVDTAHPSDVFSASEKISIAKTIGAHSAYVGFTGATGVNYSTQKIDSWTYGYGPTVTSLTAAPATITKHVTTLTAIVADPTGTKDLTYSWSEVSAPAGARAVTFSTTASHVDDTTVTVLSAGDYTFQVSVKDKNGYTVSDDVNVVRT